VKFKEFRVGRYCNVINITDVQRSNIRYCFFFYHKNCAVCPSPPMGILITRGDTYDSNYSCWIGCT
jgi:hypothetical protein